jgi:hypothetical protein
MCNRFEVKENPSFRYHHALGWVPKTKRMKAIQMRKDDALALPAAIGRFYGYTVHGKFAMENSIGILMTLPFSYSWS